MSKFKVGDRVVYVPTGTQVPETYEKVDPTNRGVITCKHSSWDDGWWVRWDDETETFFRETFGRTYLESQLYNTQVKETNMQPTRITIDYQNATSLTTDQFNNLPDGTTFTYRNKLYIVNKFTRGSVDIIAFAADGSLLIDKDTISSDMLYQIKFVEATITVKG